MKTFDAKKGKQVLKAYFPFSLSLDNELNIKITSLKKIYVTSTMLNHTILTGMLFINRMLQRPEQYQTVGIWEEI